MDAQFWREHYQAMEQPHWCGPATIAMVLSAADILIPQDKIAKAVYKDWWGTPNQLMLAYLSRFFKIVNYKSGSTFRDITYHLKKDHVVVVNWYDNYEEPYDGHYSIVAERDRFKITLADPSRGVWDMPAKDFKQRWWDYLDLNSGTYITGWLLWVNPKSKKEVPP